MKSLWLTVIMWTLVVCSVPAQKELGAPPGWKLVKDCRAEFYLPPDFKEEKVRQIDSCVKQYRGENTLLQLDVLGYFSPDASRKDQYPGSATLSMKKQRLMVGERNSSPIMKQSLIKRRKA